MVEECYDKEEVELNCIYIDILVVVCPEVNVCMYRSKHACKLTFCRVSCAHTWPTPRIPHFAISACKYSDPCLEPVMYIQCVEECNSLNFKMLPFRFLFFIKTTWCSVLFISKIPVNVYPNADMTPTLP